MRAVLAVAIAAVLNVAAPAQAQDWPQRQVTIVVPFAAGGSADLLARILQQHMQAKFGVPFVVENKSGAGGSIGTGVVAKAPRRRLHAAGGHRERQSSSTDSSTPSCHIDVERDLQPVSLLVQSAEPAGRQYRSSRRRRFRN